VSFYSNYSNLALPPGQHPVYGQTCMCPKTDLKWEKQYAVFGPAKSKVEQLDRELRADEEQFRLGP
jgi:hypothetical protein